VILLFENMLNLFIGELMVVVCHINHVINEAFERFWKAMKNFVAGEMKYNGNAVIQRLTVKW
jgi:hypothetical protein